jgi:hypothetical protein
VGTDITSEITYAKINGIEFGQLVSVPINEDILSSYSLSQNYPNPFNPSTKIRFIVTSNVKGETLNVALKVYDILGNEITTLVNEEKTAGTYEFEFNSVGTSRDLSLPSGIYFYRLQAGDFVETKKMLLLK